MKEILQKQDKHPSQRGWFSAELYEQMKNNNKIWLLTGDLGFKMFDNHFIDFPERVINCGASEQAMVGIAVGLALEKKIPFVYSITPFVLYRPYEWLRNYLQNEEIAVKLVGAGRNRDYEADGFTHWSEEAIPILDTLPKIIQFWPETKEEVPNMVKEMISNNKPSFISLRR